MPRLSQVTAEQLRAENEKFVKVMAAAAKKRSHRSKTELLDIPYDPDWREKMRKVRLFEKEQG